MGLFWGSPKKYSHKRLSQFGSLVSQLGGISRDLSHVVPVLVIPQIRLYVCSQDDIRRSSLWLNREQSHKQKKNAKKKSIVGLFRIE